MGNEIAAVIAASVAGAVSLCTLYMQYVTWRDNREIKLRAQRLELEALEQKAKLAKVHTEVNGRLGELKIRIAKEAYEMGRKFQRENGDAPSPEMPRSKVDALLDEMRGRKE